MPWMRWIGFWLTLSALVTSCVTKRTVDLTWNRYEFDQAEMGVPFRIVLYATNGRSATNAAENAYARVAQLNGMLSDYDPESEVSRLSQSSGQDKIVPVSHDLWVVLERAQFLAQKSHGAFDATVGPYVVLWRKARREQHMPDLAQLAKAGLSVGYQNVVLDNVNHTVKLTVPGMRLDFGGIAKGYAVDQALHILARMGIRSALVSGGGDIAVSDAPPGKKGWRVELPPLDATNAPPTRFVLLTHAGLSTSGDLFQRLEMDGKRYSHIVDPHTGIGLTDHSLVTVIAENDFFADSLTKVMSVLPPQDALEFLRKTPHAVARIVRQPQIKVEVYETVGFNHYYN